MRVDGEARGQLGPGGVDQFPAHPGRAAAAEPVQGGDERDVAGPHQRGRPAQRERAAEQLARERVARRHGEHVARGALQHRHVRGVTGERGHQRHRGGAAADDDHPPPGPLQVGRPALRVHELAREPLRSGERRLVPSLVAVVAGAEEQEPAGELDGAVLLRRGRDRPARRRAGPRGRHHPVPEPHGAVDPALARGVGDVVADRGAVGDRGGRRPGAERVAEGEHVGVGPDPGIAEQVPGAADRRTRLEDRPGQVRAAVLQVGDGADAGEAGADHDHVDVDGCGSHGMAVPGDRAR